MEVKKEENRLQQRKKALCFAPQNGYDRLEEGETAKISAYCDGYKTFLDEGKTERECVDYAVAPRLDLKQNPLYEEKELAYCKTHYYGGIKKYQWTTIPLALHGLVVRRDGTQVTVRIGEDPGDPQFTVGDLLPHLAGDQAKKTMGAIVSAEQLNRFVGSRPFGSEEGGDRVKVAILDLLHEKYGMVEEDFLSAELMAVPAAKAVDIGLDRSVIGLCLPESPAGPEADAQPHRRVCAGGQRRGGLPGGHGHAVGGL